VLKNEYGQDVLQVRSEVQEESGNKIFVDVDKSSGVEGFLYSTNAYFDASLKRLYVGKQYLPTDILTFKGRVADQPLLVEFFGGSANEFNLFAWNRILHATDESGQSYSYVTVTPTGLEFTYDVGTKQFVFGENVTGRVDILVEAVFGEAVKVCTWMAGNTFSFDFDDIQFDGLYLNGVGEVNNITKNKYLRLYNEAPDQETVISFEETLDLRKMLTVKNSIRTETYFLDEPIDLMNEINLRSRLVAADLLVNDSFVAEFFPEQVLQPIGFKLAAYDGNFLNLYDNLRSVADAAEIDTGLIRTTVMGGSYDAPALSMGNQLSGGSSGLDATLADYLEALVEAGSLNDITIVIAPGVDDATMHMLLGDHCQEMFGHGKYRISIGGVGLGETLEEKVARTSILNNERFSLIGDGLQLKDPVTGVKRMFSGSIAVAPFVGQLLAQNYYTSLTNQTLRNAYNVENHYDDAQHNVLHEARMITFYFDAGVKIVDAITTSTYNAYEDIHMLRIFDAVSHSLQVVMKGNVGEVNMPPRWGYILAKMQKYLETLVSVGAISDFKLLNEVRAEDIVSKRFRFRVGVIPVFPVKYIEGFVDIVPPTFVQV
jgi:hypothetical protein